MKAATFIAFDTETATAQLFSMCQIGFVMVMGVTSLLRLESLPSRKRWGLGKEMKWQANLKKIDQYNSDGAGIRIIGEDDFLGMIS